MVWWQIVITVAGGVLTILSIIAFFVNPLLKLNTSITTLSEAVKNLLKYVDKNDDCHTTFTDKLADHETRITVIEKTGKGAE
jgi:hypothetical protein